MLEKGGNLDIRCQGRRINNAFLFSGLVVALTKRRMEEAISELSLWEKRTVNGILLVGLFPFPGFLPATWGLVGAYLVFKNKRRSTLEILDGNINQVEED